ncbi:Eukaryotic translation initiation factor 4E-binding protein 2 [Camelus dromedarius]|uniref:Eukaryotic translation initiation factor 4E-binding protein 2 n=1 Tax=Camelus dromedarius TaxID=9838 RepID=A0A5N4DIF1_CAMDR|nr:Eukaryotic translation initiation factor 4E-binding protein 2 [Camelus dromedarius]
MQLNFYFSYPKIILETGCKTSVFFKPCFPGTRIIYDRKFLLDRRNSPMAQTPPCHLPNIPGVTSPGTLIEDSKVEVNNLNNLNNHDRKHAVGDDAQFEMDI